MEVTPERVAQERDWVRARVNVIVPLVNDIRAALAEQFAVSVDPISADQYHAAVDDLFADGDRAVNVAAMVAILRDLDVDGDYPGFIVDEVLGRELAATIAGKQPLRLLGEATFHYADIMTHGEAGDAAGADDLDAALAAGFQEVIPGWGWTARESPFAVPPVGEEEP
ncbi:hypothetical protein [Haloarchaeobius sp. DYHT-AS-18]|uniref:hypothetical protein n=1 Tax=Haloarchaeobius sp. DYHT-AS-18 TaxID=3446117 RepID=UPI003EBB362F